MVKNPSITRRLLWLIVVPVVLLVVMFAGVAAKMAQRSVNELFDLQMQTNARVLLSFVLYESYEHEEDEYEYDDDTEELLELADSINAEHGLPVNFRLKSSNRTRFESVSVSRFPECEIGFSNVSIAGADAWRCYRQVQPLGNGDNIIVEVFESQIERRRAIRSLVLATFSPLIVLPVLVAGLTFRAVSRAMKSLREVSYEISERSADNLQRIDLVQQPSELLPVASAVNSLLTSIENSIQREKQFTDDAAHELRTPVTSIKMLQQLLRRDNRDPALDSHLDDLQDSVNRCSDLIDQLLSFARLQTVRSIPFDDVNISELVHTELGLLSPEITMRQLAVEIEEASYSRLVYANDTAISMLVRNLLSNAVKFSDIGGVVYVFLNNHSLVIEDDGPGISEGDRQQVFDRFYRAPSVRAYSGSGLGLSLAKWAADAHRFGLRVDTPVRGRGASFVLTFNDR